MHYTHCCALALGSHYPEALHRPTHQRSRASASALFDDFLGLPDASIRSLKCGWQYPRGWLSLFARRIKYPALAHNVYV